ncbi:uncharacterized protein LOC103513797, partial [Diaphorina citri]|uniref:Uncharacterized protein LOC103513797 n=1 Tax=Diaphorina citri TaxID=121845 RepID=A0A1S3D8V8_DIACI
MYIPVLVLFFVNSISSYVINGTERTDSLDKTAYKSAYNQYKLSEELHNVKILTENDPEHGNFDKGYVKNHAKSGGASEPQGSTKSLSATDLNKLLAKANDKYSTGLNGVPNTGGVPNTDILGKYQSSIPYFVTKNDNIIGLSDVNMGTLPGGPLRGAVPNVGLPNGLGGGKMNFSMGTYMKYLTRNSSLSPSDMYKYVFSKKCANSYNMICLKLDLIKILSNINNDNNRSISIIPHVMSISMSPTTPIPDQETAADQSNDYAVLTQEDQQKLEDSQTQDLIKNKNLYEEMVLKNNYNTNYYINNILKKKIIGLLNNMSLNVKLFDNTTVEIIKKLVHGYGQSGDGANVAGEKEVFDGR